MYRIAHESEDDRLLETIEDETVLEELLSRPTDGVVTAIGQMSGDYLLLGAGGKMGPSLARMIRRALDAGGANSTTPQRRVIAVSRFTRDELIGQLNASGIETIRCDLMHDAALAALPEATNVICMTGSKFGTTHDAPSTWAANVLLPARICQRFRQSRLLAFSTGNVYPLVDTTSAGSRETDELLPLGEYGMSAVGRERMYEYHSGIYGTPVTIVRLNYAVELRYGVIVDLARRVLEGQSIDLTMGEANVIWQQDANRLSLMAFGDAASPPQIVNVAGAERLRVEDVCRHFAERFGCQAKFSGKPASTALLNDGSSTHARYGVPEVALQQILDWTAAWLLNGGRTWNKPTQFEIRNGRF
ncbi:MAG: NAD-dependent epimerase/dehydratase family protein [Pirellulaceae bacterium]|nr:NAD-dependent epimerase/dehydratase family protein [Planctomycetales bacterium]